MNFVPISLNMPFALAVGRNAQQYVSSVLWAGVTAGVMAAVIKLHLLGQKICTYCGLVLIPELFIHISNELFYVVVDANGKVELVSAPIQPIDVLSSNGRRYFVEFNELHQPIRKGGHILVKFLGFIAKMGNYCPLGELTWRKVKDKLKFDILKKMRVRISYEAEHGKLMGLIEAWERSHVRKDGSFVEGTVTADFLGFGFGVKRSDVCGVRGLVRKEGYGKGKKKFVEVDLNSNSSPYNKKWEALEKRNEELSMKYNKNNNLLKTVVTQFSEFLDVMRNGNASVQLIDVAQSTLAMATQQADASDNDAPSGDGSRSEIANAVSKS
ncbi:Phosphoinositide phosphatase SAC8 [Bienertia sinuspersici]